MLGQQARNRIDLRRDERLLVELVHRGKCGRSICVKRLSANHLGIDAERFDPFAPALKPIFVAVITLRLAGRAGDLGRQRLRFAAVASRLLQFGDDRSPPRREVIDQPAIDASDLEHAVLADVRD